MRQGGDYVINGRKWWTSGAGDPRCKICIFMGKTDPNAPTHKQQSMILVPMDTPGVEVIVLDIPLLLETTDGGATWNTTVRGSVSAGGLASPTPNGPVPPIARLDNYGYASARGRTP